MRKFTIIFVLISMFFLFSPFQFTYAEDTFTIIKNRGEVEEQISSLSKRIDSLNHEINKLKKQESKVEQEILQSNQILQEKKEARDRTLDSMNHLSSEIEVLEREYRDALERFEQRSYILRNRLITLQEDHSPLKYLSIILGSKSFEELLSRLSAMITLIGADQELIQQSLSEQNELAEKQVKLEKAKEKLVIEKNNLQVQINEVETEKQSQTKLLNKIKERQQTVLQVQEKANQKNEDLLKEQRRLNQKLTYVPNSISEDLSGGVPVEYLPFYISSGQKHGVDWEILAAIHKLETNYSNHPTMVSSAGAVGHMQFLELTWVGYMYDSGNGKPPTELDITDLEVIKRGGGYGIDADGDGIADPYNLADAIESAASYLAKNGYAANPAKAIWHYNRAQWYVDKVLTTAEKIKTLYKDTDYL